MQPKAAYTDGQSVGGTPYRVVRCMGGGGMGTVYEVEDTSIGKHYVLKTVHAELAHRADLNELIRKEARLLARVRHKHIVDVITAGKTTDAFGLPYIVMEKLDGVTLKTLLATMRLPSETIHQVANELLDALHHMHHPVDDRMPMIHRDIKPENIFLAKDLDGFYVTKVLDLGIAAWLDGQKQRGFHGTIKYAAPEQLRGDALSPQTDLYQAALVFFEMLTGRHPFADARTEREMIDAALNREPPRVSAFADVPKRVDDAIDNALSKVPARRPGSAHAFMMTLQGLRGGRGAAAPVLSNTTIEDLHTAIEKHADAGYEAYAAAECSTVEGMSAPPVAKGTLEEASPSFALGSTTPGPNARAGTERIVTPANVNAKGNANAQGGVDRRAATRSRHESEPPRRAGYDTEELLGGLVSAPQADRPDARASERRQSTPRPSAPPLFATPPAAPSLRVESFEAGTATPLSASVSTGEEGSGSPRARRWGLAAAAIAIAAAGAGTAILVQGATGRDVPAREMPAVPTSATVPVPVPVASVPAAPSATIVAVAPSAVTSAPDPAGARAKPTSPITTATAAARPVARPALSVAPPRRAAADEASPAPAPVKPAASPPTPAPRASEAPPAPKADDFMRTL